MEIITPSNLTSVLNKLHTPLIFCTIEKTLFRTVRNSEDYAQQSSAVTASTHFNIDTTFSLLVNTAQTYTASLCIVTSLAAQIWSPLISLIPHSHAPLYFLPIQELSKLSQDTSKERCSCRTQPCVLHAFLHLLSIDSTAILISGDDAMTCVCPYMDYVFARGSLEATLRALRISFRPFASLADAALQLQTLFKKKLIRQKLTAQHHRKRYFMME